MPALPTSGSVAGTVAYPARPLHLIVAFPAGTAVDALARLVAGRLAPALGQPVIVENRPGAAGNIGIGFAARAAPDGYTLAIVGAGVTINPTLYGARAVDPVRAFAPVIQLTVQPIVIVVHPALAAATLADVIELARREPGGVAYSTPGVGTPTHIAAELLALRAGISWLHVPYSGAGQLMTDVLTGEVPVSFTLLGAAQAYLPGGQLRAIAVTTSDRISALPGVPTVAESGYPGYEISSWHGIVAPAGTDDAIVARLNAEIARILLDPDVSAHLRTLGMEPAGGSASAFAARVASEQARWRAVIEKAGIKGEP
jgi:tripartite-type tricarboxylate transporter receptor subunit TctC